VCNGGDFESLSTEYRAANNRDRSESIETVRVLRVFFNTRTAGIDTSAAKTLAETLFEFTRQQFASGRFNEDTFNKIKIGHQGNTLRSAMNLGRKVRFGDVPTNFEPDTPQTGCSCSRVGRSLRFLTTCNRQDRAEQSSVVNNKSMFRLGCCGSSKVCVTAESAQSGRTKTEIVAEALGRSFNVMGQADISTIDSKVINAQTATAVTKLLFAEIEQIVGSNPLPSIPRDQVITTTAGRAIRVLSENGLNFNADYLQDSEISVILRPIFVAALQAEPAGNRRGEQSFAMSSYAEQIGKLSSQEKLLLEADAQRIQDQAPAQNPVMLRSTNGGEPEIDINESELATAKAKLVVGQVVLVSAFSALKDHFLPQLQDYVAPRRESRSAFLPIPTRGSQLDGVDYDQDGKLSENSDPVTQLPNASARSLKATANRSATRSGMQNKVRGYDLVEGLDQTVAQSAAAFKAAIQGEALMQADRTEVIRPVGELGRTIRSIFAQQLARVRESEVAITTQEFEAAFVTRSQSDGSNIPIDKSVLQIIFIENKDTMTDLFKPKSARGPVILPSIQDRGRRSFHQSEDEHEVVSHPNFVTDVDAFALHQSLEIGVNRDAEEKV